MSYSVKNPPTLNIPDKLKQSKVEQIMKPFFMSKPVIERIREVFENELILGLARDPPKKSSLQMENTFIPELLDGTETGEYLALDLGGTNFRVILIKLDKSFIEASVQYYTVPDEVRIGEGNKLFDFIADCIHDFLLKNDRLDKNLPLGFCFSFPMVQKALDVGELVTWTKSINCPDVVGKDAVLMLKEAIKRKGNTYVDVVAVVNDTTGTLVKGSFVDRKCAIGLVLATGCNACYLEKVERIAKWQGDHPGVDEVVIDTEWGAFGDNGVLDFMKTEFDKAVDDLSLLVKSFTFEKLFAGKFLGELVRQVMLELIKEGLVLNGEVTPLFSKHNSLMAADVGNIDDETKDGEAKAVLGKLGYEKVTTEDEDILRYVCNATTLRGACIVSICLASLLRRMNKPEVTIAIDGSLYKNHTRLHELMCDFIAEMAPGKKFKLILVEDGSGKGAGLVAAIAVKLRNKTKK